MKKTWQTLRYAIGKTTDKSSIVESLLTKDGPSEDPHKIADCFNFHFSTMAEKIAEKIVPTDRPPDLNHKIFNSSFNTANFPISTYELLKTVACLKSKNSSDLNGISTTLIKKCIFSIARPLKHILDLSFSSGIVPDQLKVAKIIPIYKAGDKTNPDNYRPISLLCTFSKIFEKIMAQRLTNYLEQNSILSDFQFGFRKKHSTEHPLVIFLNKISEAINKKEYALAVFATSKRRLTPVTTLYY